MWLIDTPRESWAAAIFGAAILILSMYIIGAYAGAAGQLAVAALTDSQALHREVARLEDSRTALLHAVEQERRRIESDLHDRVQHRLVALALTLGIAENIHGDDETGGLQRTRTDNSMTALPNCARCFSASCRVRSPSTD